MPRGPARRDFQDVVAWLAQDVEKTTITKLLRVSWEAVAKIVIDVVTKAIDDTRLENLYPDRRRRGLLSQGTPLL